MSKRRRAREQAAREAKEIAIKKMAEDQLLVFDKRKEEPITCFKDMLAGQSTFLICGGPSAKELPLEKICQRGIFSLAVNNMAGYVRTNAFVCSDPPSKFHAGIWLDPGIMKFIPVPKLTDGGRGVLRTKTSNGFFELRINEKPVRTIHCPNVWGFGRCSEWSFGDEFFTSKEAMWGNGDAGMLKNGNPKTFCTMLLGLRLLHHLGSRRIFLIGADFHMKNDDHYAFGSGRTDRIHDPSYANSHNDQYKVVNDGLCKMTELGTFKRAGVEVYNCYKNSGLRAFPYVPFEKAVQETLKYFPKELDLCGWYEKN